MGWFLMGMKRDREREREEMFVKRYTRMCMDISVNERFKLR